MRSNTNEPEIRDQHLAVNPDVTYDATDMSARGVFGFLFVLAIAVGLVIVLLWGLYKYAMKGEVELRPSISPPIVTGERKMQRVGGDPAVTFPAPRLQPDPVADMNKFREREEEILNSYGWVDQARGTVHIPIEQAIQIVAKTGLPARANVPAPPAVDAVNEGSAAGVNVSRAIGEYQKKLQATPAPRQTMPGSDRPQR
ncbi:MAG: hypothetical protein ACE14L_03740 [Terriglobales bacterium]